VLLCQLEIRVRISEVILSLLAIQISRGLVANCDWGKPSGLLDDQICRFYGEMPISKTLFPLILPRMLVSAGNLSRISLLIKLGHKMS